jgi:hypothetical protein
MAEVKAAVTVTALLPLDCFTKTFLGSRCCLALKTDLLRGRQLNDSFVFYIVRWKPLIMITLGHALFDNIYRTITLSGGYKNLHYLTQFIVTVQPPGKPVSTPELLAAPLSTNTLQ